MKRLIVFMSKMGAGKSTLINELFPGHSVLDVWPFVSKYFKDGKIQEDKTIQGYHEMYAELDKQEDDLVILELGTNHPELNIEKLAAYKKKVDVHVFILTASVQTLLERIKNRGNIKDMESIERRLARDFPNSHLQLFEKAGIEPHFLDAEQPMTDNIILVKQLLRAAG